MSSTTSDSDLLDVEAQQSTQGAQNSLITRGSVDAGDSSDPRMRLSQPTHKSSVAAAVESVGKMMCAPIKEDKRWICGCLGAGGVMVCLLHAPHVSSIPEGLLNHVGLFAAGTALGRGLLAPSAETDSDGDQADGRPERQPLLTSASDSVMGMSTQVHTDNSVSEAETSSTEEVDTAQAQSV
jgi:hypothetical protein